jgi:hypothetical protein
MPQPPLITIDVSCKNTCNNVLIARKNGEKRRGDAREEERSTLMVGSSQLKRWKGM